MCVSALAVLVLVAACGGTTRSGGSGGDGGGGSDGGCPDLNGNVSSCVADSTIACVGSTVGFSCASGVDPEEEDPTYSCSIATTTCDAPCACEAHYCCVVATALGLPSQCSSDNTLACPPGVDSFGYQCSAGVDLSDAPSLECGTATPDPDGGTPR